MERIVNQGASLSSKQMAKDYVESVKYKKMKGRQMAVSVEKIIEKKKKMVLDAKSHILPLINMRKNNSPGPERPSGIDPKKNSITEDARNELYSGAYDKREAQDLINIAYAANDSKGIQSLGDRFS